MTIKHLLAAAAVLTATLAAIPCTVFFAFDGKQAIAGENEDWLDPNTQVWFVPASKTTHGVVYFGFGKGIYPKGGVAEPKAADNFDGDLFKLDKEATYGVPQSAINDKGLYVGGAATPVIDNTKASGKKIFAGNLMHYIMTKCATVRDVEKVLATYDARMAEGQLLFADKSGTSIILEGNGNVLQRSGKFQVMTNFLLSDTKEITCPRYKKVTEMLSDKDTISNSLLASCAQATSVKEPNPHPSYIHTWTQYSLVCNLTKGEVMVYWNGNFDDSAKVSITKELAHGEHAMTIKQLFATASVRR